MGHMILLENMSCVPISKNSTLIKLTYCHEPIIWSGNFFFMKKKKCFLIISIHHNFELYDHKRRQRALRSRLKDLSHMKLEFKKNK